MVWIAVVLGLFLFYRHVERRHKILLSLSGFALLVTIVFGATYGWNWLKDRGTKSGIKIKFTSKKPVVDLAFPQEAVSILKKVKPDLFKPETKQEIESLKVRSSPEMNNSRRIPGEKVSEAVLMARL